MECLNTLLIKGHFSSKITSQKKKKSVGFLLFFQLVLESVAVIHCQNHLHLILLNAVGICQWSSIEMVCRGGCSDL